jgi:hypothetical protein
LVEQQVLADGEVGNAELIGRLMHDDDARRARALGGR